MGKSSEALKVASQYRKQHTVGGKYINGIHPFRSLTGRELSPFTPHLGVLARAADGSGGHEVAEKQNGNDAKKRTHLRRGLVSAVVEL